MCHGWRRRSRRWWGCDWDWARAGARTGAGVTGVSVITPGGVTITAARPASRASFSLKSFSNDDSCVFQAGAVCLSEYTIKPSLVPPVAGVVQSWRRAVSISSPPARLRRRNARSLTFQITIPAMPLLAAIVSQQKRISNTTCSVLMFC